MKKMDVHILSFHSERINRVQEMMEKRGIDVLVLIKPQNQFYISDFNPIIYSNPIIALLGFNSDPLLIVPLSRSIHAEDESRIKDIRTYGMGDADSLDLVDLIQEHICELNQQSGTIGLELSFITYELYQKLKNVFPDAEFVDGMSLIDEMRMVKDHEELKRIQIASKIADKGMEIAFENISEGITEVMITQKILEAMIREWATQHQYGEVSGFGVSDVYILQSLFASCTSGQRIRRLCDAPIPKKLARGEFALPVISTMYNGYHSEIERTFAINPLKKRHLNAYNVILEAQQSVFDVIRPGVTCSDLHNAAKNVIASNGYLGRSMYQFAPNSGHGIGLGSHEKPSIQNDDQTVLQIGMVLAVEPALYHEEFGGVRHSDTIVVTEDGFDFLTTFNHGLLIIE